MSSELVDFRGKITAETRCALEAVRHATGADNSETVREVMHAWALSKIKEATILQRLLRSEGVAGAQEGVSGESQGTKLKWDEK